MERYPGRCASGPTTDIANGQGEVTGDSRITAKRSRCGRENPELTLRVYAHLMPGDGKEPARVLDRMFGNYKNTEPEGL